LHVEEEEEEEEEEETLYFNRVHNYSQAVVSLMALWNINTTITKILKSLMMQTVAQKNAHHSTLNPYKKVKLVNQSKLNQRKTYTNPHYTHTNGKLIQTEPE